MNIQTGDILDGINMRGTPIQLRVDNWPECTVVFGKNEGWPTAVDAREVQKAIVTGDIQVIRDGACAPVTQSDIDSEASLCRAEAAADRFSVLFFAGCALLAGVASALLQWKVMP